MIGRNFIAKIREIFLNTMQKLSHESYFVIHKSIKNEMTTISYDVTMLTQSQNPSNFVRI